LMEVLYEVQTLVDRELRKWIRSPVLLFMVVFQPLVWMGLFGKAFNLTGVLRIPEEALAKLPPTVTAQVADLFNKIMIELFGSSDLDYFSYMSIGMLSIVVLFSSMSGGMSIAWDRRLGILNKFLAAPIKRGSIIVAKVMAGMIRSLAQAALILFFALALGARFNPSTPLASAYVLVILALLSLGLGSLFISLGVRLRSWESQMAVMNLLNLPLMFASNALYPIRMMPSWLQAVALVNPISYAVDGVRQALLLGSSANTYNMLYDLAVTALFAAALTTIGALMADRGLRRG